MTPINGNPPITGGCPHKGSVMRSFGAFYIISLRWIDKLKCHIKSVHCCRKQCSFENVFELSEPYDDVIKWKHLPIYWPFVRGIARSAMKSPHKGQWRDALMISLIFAWTNGWVNNRVAGDMRRHRAHYDVTLLKLYSTMISVLFAAIIRVYTYNVWPIIHA